MGPQAMAVKERIPKAMRMPAGFASLGLMIVGVIIGYILFMLGGTLYFGLAGLEEGVITAADSILVSSVGLVSLGIGYLGWKGFNNFAY